jgi:hypothetical protein
LGDGATGVFPVSSGDTLRSFRICLVLVFIHLLRQTLYLQASEDHGHT